MYIYIRYDTAGYKAHDKNVLEGELRLGGLVLQRHLLLGLDLLFLVLAHGSSNQTLLQHKHNKHTHTRAAETGDMQRILDTARQNIHRRSGARDWAHRNQRRRFVLFQVGLALRPSSAATTAEEMLVPSIADSGSVGRDGLIRCGTDEAICRSVG